jgi:hypothetical protein
MYLPHVLFLYLLAASAIGLMMYAGLAKHALERKSRAVICPSCGREAGRGCRCRRS